jgi:hypothetical protein
MIASPGWRGWKDEPHAEPPVTQASRQTRDTTLNANGPASTLYGRRPGRCVSTSTQFQRVSNSRKRTESTSEQGGSLDDGHDDAVGEAAADNHPEGGRHSDRQTVACGDVAARTNY